VIALRELMTGTAQGRGQRGQSIVEFAMVTPLLILLILGVFDTSTMASNKVVAISAARNGARLGAVLGGVSSNNASCRGSQHAGTSLVQVDNAIVNDIVGIAFEAKKNGNHTSGLVHADLTEVAIYNPPIANTSGIFNDGVDPANKYTISTTVVSGNTLPVVTAKSYGGPAFPLTARCQAPQGSEAEIGVRLIWTYMPPDNIPASSITFGPAPGNLPADYAVERAALCTDNCLAVGS
jgi:Flp pilus assembly protein TadG